MTFLPAACGHQRSWWPQALEWQFSTLPPYPLLPSNFFLNFFFELFFELFSYFRNYAIFRNRVIWTFFVELFLNLFSNFFQTFFKLLFRSFFELPPTHRQETLDLPYLTLLCDNLKNGMFLQNFFSWHYFGNFLTAASYRHHSTNLPLNKRMFYLKTPVVFDLEVLFLRPERFCLAVD
jgi:hypothetical protein